MIVSIGMLAWNEEKRIAATIRSLFRQSVFRRREHDLATAEWEVVVVPNGCTDATADVARATLSECLTRLDVPAVSARVVELGTAGKSNAWNLFIHEYSRRDADVILLLDADIEFHNPDTIYNVVGELSANTKAEVVVDLPLKDISRKPRKSMLEKLSLGVSERSLAAPPGLTGQFYCGRAATFRAIWMPAGLAVEDGFLRAMIVTDLFRKPVDDSRIVRAPNASHFFEASTNLRNVFQHEVRLVIGTALNCYLTWDFLRFATDPLGPGAGVLIRDCLRHEPDWYQKFIENEVRNRGWWVLPRGLLFRRFKRLQRSSLSRSIIDLPLVFALFLFDLAVFLVANKRIKSGKAIGFW